MVEDHAVGLLAGGGLFQFRDGFGIFALAKEHPAEAVAIGQVVGLGVDGLLDHPLRPREVLVLVGPEIAQVVQGALVVGELVEHLFQPFLGLRHVALDDAQVRERQPGVADHVAGLQRSMIGVELAISSS